MLFIRMLDFHCEVVSLLFANTFLWTWRMLGFPTHCLCCTIINNSVGPLIV